VPVLAEEVLQGPVNRRLAQRLARAIEETELGELMGAVPGQADQLFQE
jgi:hypothetical protein